MLTVARTLVSCCLPESGMPFSHCCPGGLGGTRCQGLLLLSFSPGPCAGPGNKVFLTTWNAECPPLHLGYSVRGSGAGAGHQDSPCAAGRQLLHTSRWEEWWAASLVYLPSLLLSSSVLSLNTPPWTVMGWSWGLERKRPEGNPEGREEGKGGFLRQPLRVCGRWVCITVSTCW